jgi:hypothetical protein
LGGWGSLDRKKYIYSFYLSKSKFNASYPNLKKINWTVKQTKQIIEQWEIRSRDPEKALKDNFNIAEVLAGDPDFQKTIKTTPLKFIFGAIFNDNIFLPENYEHPGMNYRPL